MEIKIETYNADDYEEIKEVYGEALSKFGLHKKDDDAYINISLIEELISLSIELKELAVKADRDVPDFGLVIHSDRINIKDDWY